MSEFRSRLAHLGVYLAVRFAIVVVQILSWDVALKLANGLAWLAHRLDRRHRAVAAENLRHAFPEMSESAIAALVEEMYLHWATVAIEIVRMPRCLQAQNLPHHFPYDDPADYQRALSFMHQPGGKILLTGHFGNFEAMSYMLGLFGARGAVVARRLDNPYLDRFLRIFREKTGQQILDKNHDYEEILQTLARGEGLGMLADQDAGARGLYVDFFGRPASTFKSIGLLSVQYQVPIIVLGVARVGHPLRFQVYLEDIIDPKEHAGDRDPVKAITQRYTQALERLVRRHPEQYFWLHRRWKHQPKRSPRINAAGATSSRPSDAGGAALSGVRRSA